MHITYEHTDMIRNPFYHPEKLKLYNLDCYVFLLLLALLHDDKNYTIARLTCLATYINTIFILGNMFQALDLQNIFNPFNGTLIERKQDT